MKIEKYYKKINLTENEEVDFVLLQHPIVKGHLMILALVLLILPFFFMFKLLEMGGVGATIFISLLVVFFTFVFREYYMWAYNCFVVTNKKIVDIDQRGVFNKIVSEVPFSKVLDVSYQSKGVTRSILGIGDITITTSIPDLKLMIKHVPNVKLKVADIIELVEKGGGMKDKGISHSQKMENFDDFLNESMEQYADYSLKDLIEEYSEVYSVSKLKKLIITELSKASDEVDNQN